MAIWFKGSKDLKDPQYPPRPDWVGKFVGADTTSREFDGKTSETLVLSFEPMNTGEVLVDENGHFHAYWRQSEFKSALYASQIADFEAAVAEVMGPSFELSSDTIHLLYGKLFLLGEADRVSEKFDYMGKMKANIGGDKKRHPFFVKGAAPAGLEQTIPEDFATKRAAAIVRARQFAADSAAGQGTHPTVIGDYTPASTVSQEPAYDLMPYEQILLELFDGVAENQLIKRAASFRGKVPDEIVDGVMAGEVGGLLLAQNKITKDGGVYRVMAAA